MNSAKEKLASCGIAVPQILMPKKGIDPAKWAVIACDQFSSDKTYWKNIENHVSDSPSTLRMILPECYLNESEARVAEINKTMSSYLDQGILNNAGTGFVFLKRSTPWTTSRYGLMAALDLEQYSYEKGAECRIRPTEGTVLERLPVRAAIRENAVLDIPHILVLFDDPEKRIFSLLERNKTELSRLYDFDLFPAGGHLEGYLVEDKKLIGRIADIFVEFNEKNDFLFAVGDGNHSLGAAKQLWEKIKSQGGKDIMNHPARWALVELENIHDKGLNFEPIHRVLFNLDTKAFLKELENFESFSLQKVENMDTLKRAVESQASGPMDGNHAAGILVDGKYFLLTIDNREVPLAAEAFHLFLDPWMKKNPGIEVDYIHGEEALKDLSSKDGNMGFYLPGIDKSSFFSLISEKGALPRKTFSIGEAEEKRYYMESRKIIR